MISLYFFRIVDRGPEIELPSFSSVRRKRGMTERMYGSDFDTLQPDVKALPQIYAGDKGTLSLGPKNKER